MASVYPAQIDNTASLPAVIDLVTPVRGYTVNVLRDALIRIESTLGVQPSSSYGTIRARLDALENIINNPIPSGSIVFAGDLSGTALIQTVIGLQNYPVSNSPPVSGSVLTWDSSQGQWAPQLITASYNALFLQNFPISSNVPVAGQVLEYNGSEWIPTISSSIFTAGGDLSGDSTSQNVIGLYDHPLASTAPVLSAVPIWGGSLYDIRQLTLDDVAAAFAITNFNGTQTVEVGAYVTNPTFTASYSSMPTSAQISNTDGLNSPLALLSPFTSASIAGTFHHTNITSVIFTLTALGATMQTKTQNINFLARSFGGVGQPNASATVTAGGANTAILSTGDTLNNLGLLSSDVGSTFGPFSPNDQKIYLLLLGNNRGFKDASNDLPFAFLSPTTVSFLNQNNAIVGMYLYESINTLTGTFTIIVSS